MKSALAVRIVVVALGLAGALVGLVAWESVERARGQKVLLPMAAVDPRSLLTGHYAVLILRDRLPAGAPCPAGLPVKRGAGWLVLQPANGRHRVAAGARTREEALRAGGVAVRGGASCDEAWFPASAAEGAEGTQAMAVVIDIGVDRFHADQDEAEAMERFMRAGPGAGPTSLAVISVGRDGRGRLKGVIVGGRRADLDWF